MAVTNEVVGVSRWRGRANGAGATTDDGREAETQDGSGGVTGWARVAQLAKPERASHSGGPTGIGMTEFE